MACYASGKRQRLEALSDWQTTSNSGHARPGDTSVVGKNESRTCKVRSQGAVYARMKTLQRGGAIC